MILAFHWIAAQCIVRAPINWIHPTVQALNQAVILGSVANSLVGIPTSVLTYTPHRKPEVGIARGRRGQRIISQHGLPRSLPALGCPPKEWPSLRTTTKGRNQPQLRFLAPSPDFARCCGALSPLELCKVGTRLCSNSGMG